MVAFQVVLFLICPACTSGCVAILVSHGLCRKRLTRWRGVRETSIAQRRMMAPQLWFWKSDWPPQKMIQVRDH